MDDGQMVVDVQNTQAKEPVLDKGEVWGVSKSIFAM